MQHSASSASLSPNTMSSPSSLASAAKQVHPSMKLSMENSSLGSAEFKSLLDQLPQHLFEEGAAEHLQAAANVMETLDAYSDALQSACAQIDASSSILGSEPPPASSAAMELPPVPSMPLKRMDCFPPDSVQDFKHVLYNLLADNFNDPSHNTFVQPITIKENGEVRSGFRFNPSEDPDKRIPELYAQHIKKARLDWEDTSSVFIQDLYRYYMRACVELMSKYFEKRDKYTYLYDDVMLFVPSESLEEAETRIKAMKSRARKKRKMSFSP